MKITSLFKFPCDSLWEKAQNTVKNSRNIFSVSIFFLIFTAVGEKKIILKTFSNVKTLLVNEKTCQTSNRLIIWLMIVKAIES